MGRPATHGANLITRVLRESKLDHRTKLARTLRAISDELMADMGGVEGCSAAKKLLIDRSAFLALVCMSIEGHVLKEGGPMQADGELSSALRKNGYGSYQAALSRNLAALGLDPEKCNNGPTVEEYLTESRTESE